MLFSKFFSFKISERRSLSVGSRNRSASRNLDLHEKLDKIPHFCEDLSALMEEPLFDPLIYLVSRHGTPSDPSGLFFSCSMFNC